MYEKSDEPTPIKHSSYRSVKTTTLWEEKSICQTIWTVYLKFRWKLNKSLRLAEEGLSFRNCKNRFISFFLF